MLQIFIRTLLTLSFFFNYSQAQDLEKVSLQLQWKYQFQFAGFIVAKENGYYVDEGLDVKLIEYNNTNNMKDLVDGKVDFAISNAIVVYRDKKLQDVSLLATYFQRSPLVIIAQPEIKTVLDLKGKRIELSESDLHNSSLSVMLSYFSINNKNTNFVKQTFKMDDFIAKRTDAVAAFRSNEVFELNQKNIPYNVIDPVEYGFSTNAINLFASHEKVKNSPQQINKFLRATQKGWEYALENIDEVALMIHQKYQANKSLELLKYEGKVTKELMLLNMYEIGEVNSEFVTKTFKQLVKNGKIDTNQNPNKLIYKNKKSSHEREIELTLQEKKYIQNNPIITYSEINWKPLSIIENSTMNGIMGDYLALISQRTGLKFKFVESDSWLDVLEKFKKRDIDLIPGIGSSSQEMVLGSVSRVYASYLMVIVTTNKYNYVDSLEEFKSGTVAVPEFYASHNFMLEKFPNIELIETKNIEEALFLVESGRADAFVGHIASSLYHLSYLNLNDLKIAGTASFEFEHRFLTQDTNLELASIINKALKTITQEDRNRINAKWVHTRVEQSVDLTIVYSLVLILIMIMLLIVSRQRILAKHNRELKQLKERHELALLGNSDGIWDWDLVTGAVYYSPRWKEMLGYNDDELLNEFASWKYRVHRDDVATVFREIKAHMAGKIDYMDNIHRLRHKDGHWVWIHNRSKAIFDENGKAIRMIGTHTDVTKEKNIEIELSEQKEILHYQANHDILTGLPNRALFADRLKKGIEKAKRNRSKLALLFIDLDHFKEINDSLGHNVGDDVLKAIALRLQKVIREKDTLARLGGDEFIIILEDLHEVQDASLISTKIIDKLSKALTLDEHNLYVSSSIGISIYPDDGSSVQNLLKYADSAMYKAKNEGRNNFQYYSSEMTELAFERVVMEASLRAALANEEFVVYYQPQVDGRHNTLVGMEALVRWNHPTMGIVSPAKFIPLAESTGLIVEIDRYVMKSAMKQIAQWYEEGLNPGILAMNLAMKQLQKDDFIETLENLIEETECKAEWMELEVTEGQIMNNPQEAIIILQKISDLGIELAVDDFGTGYSSLAYLKKLPIDKLKIDQAFVRYLPDDEEDAAIAKAVIALGKSLNLSIIAEGVEKEAQKEFLVQNGSSYIQGYFYSRPVPADEMKKILQNGF